MWKILAFIYSNSQNSHEWVSVSELLTDTVSLYNWFALCCTLLVQLKSSRVELPGSPHASCLF